MVQCRQRLAMFRISTPTDQCGLPTPSSPSPSAPSPLSTDVSFPLQPIQPNLRLEARGRERWARLCDLLQSQHLHLRQPCLRYANISTLLSHYLLFYSCTKYRRALVLRSQLRLSRIQPFGPCAHHLKGCSPGKEIRLRFQLKYVIVVEFTQDCASASIAIMVDRAT